MEDGVGKMWPWKYSPPGMNDLGFVRQKFIRQWCWDTRTSLASLQLTTKVRWLLVGKKNVSLLVRQMRVIPLSPENTLKKSIFFTKKIPLSFLQVNAHNSAGKGISRWLVWGQDNMTLMFKLSANWSCQEPAICNWNQSSENLLALFPVFIHPGS